MKEEKCEGGILGLDMGLGKTLVAISLVESDQRTGHTLVLMPPGIKSQWLVEVSKLQAARVTYKLFEDLASAPPEGSTCVIMSYYQLLSVPPGSWIFRTTWRRLICDEGHRLKNRSSLVRKKADSLVAEARWLLTGTPCHNSIAEWSSLLNFIRSKPYGMFSCLLTGCGCLTASIQPRNSLCHCGHYNDLHTSMFRRHVTENMKHGRVSEAFAVLEEIRCQNVFRVTKDDVQSQVSLSSLKIEHSIVNLDKNERMFYDGVFQASRERLLALTTQNDKVLFVSALAEIMTLRFLVNHRYLVHFNAEWDVHVDPANPRSRLLSSSDTSSSLAALISTGRFIASSKMRAIVGFIQTIERAEKVLLFSSFERFLKLLSFALTSLGISNGMFTGKDSKRKRQATLVDFKAKSGPQVLLATLGTAAEGLNIQSANVVVLADPWWNPYLEKQAIGRAHRIGQKKGVRVVHFITEDTIESRILEVQERKRRLVDAIVDRGTTGIEESALTLDDIRRIFVL